MNVASVPGKLRMLSQWVIWRSEVRDGHHTKVPYTADGRRASTADRATWLTFDDALAAWTKHGADGLGFVFSDNDPFTGIDLDDCRNASTGEVAPWAWAIVALMDSYTEVSPSGSGLHIVAMSDVKDSRGRKSGNVEIYSRGRYFTVTGQHLPGTPAEVRVRSEQLRTLERQVSDAPRAPSGRGRSYTHAADVSYEECMAIVAGIRAHPGGRFTRLWNGDWRGDYRSQSEADLAFCGLLARVCADDRGRIDAVFRKSRLFRSKWDERHCSSGRSYGEMTIDRVLSDGAIPDGNELGTADCGGRNGGSVLTAKAGRAIPPGLPEGHDGLCTIEQLLRAAGLDDGVDGIGMDGLRERLLMLRGLAAGRDRLTLGLLRAALTDRLRKAGVTTPAKVVEAAIGGTEEKSGSLLQGRYVSFLETDAWPEPVDGAAMLEDLREVFRRYLVLPSGAEDALALWTVHTHALDLAENSPRLAIISPEKRCGKTRLLHVLRGLVARPLLADNITAAALFRTIEIHRPTLLIDEADSFLVGRDDLRGILNAGHTPDGQVIRTVGENFEPRAFRVWSPVAIAAIRGIPATLADRAVVLHMRRRRAGEEVERVRSSALKRDLEPLHRRVRRWVQDSRESLSRAEPPVPAGLDDRAADNWRPLLAIASVAGGDWLRRATASAVTLCADRAESEDSLGVLLLGDLRQVFAASGADRLSTEEILSHLVALDERPWSDYRRGKAITSRQLAGLLKSFGVRSGTIRLDGGRTPKGYCLRDLEEVFERYVPS